MGVPSASSLGEQDARASALAKLRSEIVTCTKCPRLIRHCQEVATIKRRAYREETYWGKPVPGFGDPDAVLLVIGLAPAAHGANRTGRMFTGDSSGDWLYRAMHRAGFATQPTSTSIDDGLQLVGAYVTAAGRCAPPQNRMTAAELSQCRPFLHREIEILNSVRAVVCLGRVAFDAYLKAAAEKGVAVVGEKPVFAHGATFTMADGRKLIASYHPSRQNTQTGRLTEEMFDHVFRLARLAVDGR